MLISKAYAQEIVIEGADALEDTPSTMSVIISNMLPILVLAFLFYFLLIRPQAKRFREHRDMLDALKKGDKIVTSGGLVGKIDKLVGKDEVIVDLGNDIKVTAMRSTIQSKADKEITAKKDAKKDKVL